MPGPRTGWTGPFWTPQAQDEGTGPEARKVPENRRKSPVRTMVEQGRARRSCPTLPRMGAWKMSGQTQLQACRIRDAPASLDDPIVRNPTEKGCLPSTRSRHPGLPDSARRGLGPVLAFFVGTLLFRGSAVRKASSDSSPDTPLRTPGDLLKSPCEGMPAEVVEAFEGLTRGGEGVSPHLFFHIVQQAPVAVSITLPWTL